MLDITSIGICNIAKRCPYIATSQFNSSLVTLNA